MEQQMKGWKIYWQWFKRKSKTFKLSFCIVLLSILTAIFADVIANDKPLVCQCNGTWRWPAFRQYAENFGWLPPTHSFDYVDCHKKIMPIFPFASSTIDPSASGYLSPVKAWSAGPNKHWLGTDALGRDVLAGLVHGARYAWVIGLWSTLLAAIPGIFIGMTIGYLKNQKLKLSLWQIIFFVVLGFFFFYELYILIAIYHGPGSLLFIAGLSALAWGVVRFILKKTGGTSKQFFIPVDDMVMRFIDFFESFPRLFLMMALLVFMARPSLNLMILLIAFIRWPLFAQVARAETLRESALNYVLATENIGIPWYKILTRHIWPNIKSALFITALFSISTAILLEASLSFIGLGLKLEQVTWGSILNEGRQYLPGWWLSIFPGLAIFLVLISLHWIWAEKDQSDGPREGW